MNNYLVSALLPFIEEDEIAYYSSLDEDVLLRLIALSPFVNSSEQLQLLSKLNVEKLDEVAEKIPQMEENKIWDYLRRVAEE